MKLLKREDIDAEIWDQRIRESAIENIFCYSWYLDAVSENWMAVITDNYQTVVPVPFTSKLGVKQFYQAPFSREYDIFGDEFNWSELAAFLKDDFKGMQFRNREEDLFANAEIRIHQYLKLDENFSERYKTNARRILKKAGTLYSIGRSSDFQELIELFERTTAHKIDSISEEDIVNLNSLMNTAIDSGQGELFCARQDEKTVAAAFFLKDKKRITYLKGSAEDEAKKNGAMYVMMDHVFRIYQSKFETFDFGGSDIENVSNFYKKFGAVDRRYYNYQIDHLPIWFKTLKKLKS
ncbi:GNAT family N-acetyltransferase [Crocinitomix catalasitica]|nr:GNAT family N-acetyltransferase [Crocinitomix catalasitica]